MSCQRPMNPKVICYRKACSHLPPHASHNVGLKRSLNTKTQSRSYFPTRNLMTTRSLTYPTKPWRYNQPSYQPVALRHRHHHWSSRSRASPTLSNKDLLSLYLGTLASQSAANANTFPTQPTPVQPLAKVDSMVNGIMGR